MFILFAIIFFLPLYIRDPAEWQKILAFSLGVAAFLVFTIWYRGLSPEYVVDALKQGNGYRFFT